MDDIAKTRSSVAESPASAEALLAYAHHLLNGNDPGGGERIATRCLGAAPAEPRALIVLAYAAISRGDAHRSMRLARQAACLGPAEPGGLKMLLMSFALLHRAREQAPSIEPPFLAWTMRALAVAREDGFYNYCLIEFLRHRATARNFDRAVDIVGRQQNRALPTEAPEGALFYLNRGTILRFLGEMAKTLDCLSKQIALGLLPRGTVLSLERPEEVANRDALALWRSAVRLVDASSLDRLRRFGTVVDIDTTFFRFGKRFYAQDVVVAAVQRNWERQRRAPLLHGGRNHPAFRAFIERHGWRANDRIVCLHLRESLYNRELGRGIEQDFRNTNVASFGTAIDALLARGFRVVRIGRAGVAPLAEADGVFDLANSRDKSELLDVLVIGACDLYLGSASGPSSLAAAFGRPSCIVDYAQVSGPMPLGRCIYVPKLWQSRRNGRILPLSRMLSPPFRNITRGEVLAQEQVLQISNTPEDIRDASIETVERFVDGDEASPNSMQERARTILKRHKVIALGRISAAFLDRHDDWVR